MKRLDRRLLEKQPHATKCLKTQAMPGPGKTPYSQNAEENILKKGLFCGNDIINKLWFLIKKHVVFLLHMSTLSRIVKIMK